MTACWQGVLTEDDIKYQLADCCKQLKLSSGLAERAMTMQGDSHQEYLAQLQDWSTAAL